jgi:hypothetical protein
MSSRQGALLPLLGLLAVIAVGVRFCQETGDFLGLESAAGPPSDAACPYSAVVAPARSGVGVDTEQGRATSFTVNISVGCLPFHTSFRIFSLISVS